MHVAPDAAQTLGLALHELATNASKYGALSVSGGSVAVQWNIEPGSGAPRFRMSWRERGGPECRNARAQRFRGMLIERLTAEKLDATVMLTFDREGVVWTLDRPRAMCWRTSTNARDTDPASAAPLADYTRASGRSPFAVTKSDVPVHTSGTTTARNFARIC